MTNVPKSVWSDELVERLKALWADGNRSASDIAKELGAGISRNAVIGKIHRLGLSGRVAGRSSPRQRKLSEPKSKPRGAPHQSPIPFTPRVVHTEFRSLHVTELVTGDCRWPEGGDNGQPIVFCGCTVRESSPYCDQHHQIAFQKPVSPEEQERRREHGRRLARMMRDRKAAWA